MENMGFTPCEVVALGYSLECVANEFVDYSKDLMVESKIFPRYEPPLNENAWVDYCGSIRFGDSVVGVDTIRWGLGIVNNILGFFCTHNNLPFDLTI